MDLLDFLDLSDFGVPCFDFRILVEVSLEEFLSCAVEEYLKVGEGKVLSSQEAAFLLSEEGLQYVEDWLS